MKAHPFALISAVLLAAVFTSNTAANAKPPSEADALWASITAQWEKLAPMCDHAGKKKRLATISASRAPDYAQLVDMAREFQAKYPKDPRRKEAKKIESNSLFAIVIIEGKARGTTTIIKSAVTYLTPVKQTFAAEPLWMEDSGKSGKVTIEFTLDKKGRPRNLVVVLSPDGRLDEPALKAIGKWRFQIPNPKSPDSLGNKYAKLSDARWQYEVNFGKTRVNPFNDHFVPFPLAYSYSSAFNSLGVSTMDGRVRGAGVPVGTEEPERVRGIQPGATTPGQNIARPVIPHESVETVAPVYPYPMLIRNIRGSATVRIPCNTGWQDAQPDIIEASHKNFGYALAAAMRYYTVKPRLYKGQPAASMLTATFDFNPENSETCLSEKTRQLLADETQNPEKIISEDQLDLPLSYRNDATISMDFINTELKGSTIIEFLVDEAGRVHLPRIIKTDDLEAAYILMQEVSLRVYTPPMQNGNPVVARVQEKKIF